VSFQQIRGGAPARRVAAVHLHDDNDPSSLDAAPQSVAPSSGVGPSLEAGDAELGAAAREGHEYLIRVMEPHGIQSRVGLDAAFQRTIEARELRAFVQEKLGADLGFDAGDEAFSSMIALRLFASDPAAQATVARSLSLVRGRSFRGRYRFFCDENGFAADTDCTGVAVSALFEAGWLSTEELLASGEELLKSAAAEDVPASANLDEATGKSNGELRAGVVMVYWEDFEEPDAAPRGRKHDAAVAANALYALKLGLEMGLEDPRGIAKSTLRYVSDHLRSGAYLQGTRYYPSPDTFLYYVSSLCRRFSDCMAELGGELRRALRRRSEEPANPGSPDDQAGALNVAQRAIAACNIGATKDLRWDLVELAAMQLADGSWRAAPFYSLGKQALYFGSSAVTTMFVVKAITAGTKAAQRSAPARPQRALRRVVQSA
jgi:hypothetical protein